MSFTNRATNQRAALRRSSWRRRKCWRVCVSLSNCLTAFAGEFGPSSGDTNPWTGSPNQVPEAYNALLFCGSLGVCRCHPSVFVRFAKLTALVAGRVDYLLRSSGCRLANNYFSQRWELDELFRYRLSSARRHSIKARSTSTASIDKTGREPGNKLHRRGAPRAHHHAHAVGCGGPHPRFTHGFHASNGNLLNRKSNKSCDDRRSRQGRQCCAWPQRE